jgi:hypothetical protein
VEMLQQRSMGPSTTTPGLLAELPGRAGYEGETGRTISAPQPRN